MIHEVTSSLQSFKTLSFNPGLNILLAERTPGEKNLKDTRNGAGKSSLIEIIHFLLGASAKPKKSIFRLTKLSNYEFGLDFDLGQGRVQVKRSGKKQSSLTIQGKIPDWPPIFPPPSSEKSSTIPLDTWKTILGQIVFKLPSELPSCAPTFRMLMPYFIRRKEDGGFSKPTEYFNKISTWQRQTALSTLFNLDWEISREFAILRNRNKEMKSLKKLSTQGDLSNIIGSASELRPELARSEKRLSNLKTTVKSFKIVPEYRKLEQEASAIKKQLDKLSQKNTTDKILRGQLQDAITNETPHAPDLLFKMYEQAGIQLQENIKHRFEEVQEFHKTIISNRKIHLQSEIDSIARRIIDRSNKMNEIGQRRTTIMQKLYDGGALDQLTNLQQELGKMEAGTEALRKKLTLVKKIERLDLDLKTQQLNLQRQIQNDIDERDAIINDAITIFQELTVNLYGAEAKADLRIESTSNGLDISPTIRGIRSEGISSMLIFCFDLMLTILTTRQQRGPRFLIHDSHLFDGVDERQIAIALETAAKYAKDECFQYIVTMNSDTFANLHDFSKNFDINGYVLKTHLTDKKDGGLFGFKFD